MTSLRLNSQVPRLAFSFFMMFAVCSTPARAQTPAAGGQGEAAAQPGNEAEPGTNDIQPLIDALRNDKTREAILAELERLSAPAPEVAGQTAAEGTAGSKASGGAADDEQQDTSFGRRIALVTQQSAESAMASAQQIWQQVIRLPDIVSGAFGASQASVLAEALTDLALVIVTTYAVFVLLRFGARRLYVIMGKSAARSGILRTIVLLGSSTLIDAAIVVLAWGAGYAIALTLFGPFGSLGIRQTLYLNAFLFTELFKVAIRAILVPASGDLRLVPISDRAARYGTRWAALMVSLLVYGHMLVVPIINKNVSYLSGRATGTLISLVVVAIAAALTLRYRRDIAAYLLDGRRAQNGGLAGFFARHWHWPVMIYLVVVLYYVIARPTGLLLPMLTLSAQVVLAGLAGVIISGIIARAISGGVSLPDPITQRLPLLERRLNSFVPGALHVIRLLVFLAVALFAFDAIGLVDMRASLESRFGAQVTAAIVSLTFILLFAFAIGLAITSWVDYRLNPGFGHIPTAREKTLLSLLRNAATIALMIITLMFALSEVGIDIAPLLASAGVLGLAIGFGAQSLVKDIITGIFIQLENAINVGDVVTVGGTTGTVERLTIRSVSLRDVEAAYHIIPFSSVDMVSNYMRGFSYFVCDMGIGYNENIDEAKAAMFDAFAELKAEPDWGPLIIDDFEWLGLNSFDDSAVVLRTRIKTVPGKQWAVGRAYNAIIKRTFDARGIEIPYPHRTLYFGQDKDGKAPPAQVDLVSGRKDGGSEPDLAPSGAGG